MEGFLCILISSRLDKERFKDSEETFTTDKKRHVFMYSWLPQKSYFFSGMANKRGGGKNLF